jgi:coenzyme F420 hydrogenase subunit beta
MASIASGYNRPQGVGASLPAGAEALIADACPGAVVEPWTGIAPERDVYWGPLRLVATGFATDAATRFEGSSGGVVSALAIQALESGRVDRVLHVGADPENPTRNITRISRTASEVVASAGSRYTASSPLADIVAEVRRGGRLAFVGKPCDVSALRRLARHDRSIAEGAPVMLAFFCAGVPSHNGVDRILAELGVTPAEVTAFRYRGRGWPGMCAAETRGGDTLEMTYAKSWGAHLSREVQFRCKICPDAVGGVADVACADAWYGDEEGYPSFNEVDGRSLIIARTELGQTLLDEAISNGAVVIEPLDPREIGKMQPGQARRKRLVLARTAALPLASRPVPKMKGLSVAAAARRARPIDLIVNFLGALRRTVVAKRS